MSPQAHSRQPYDDLVTRALQLHEPRTARHPSLRRRFRGTLGVFHALHENEDTPDAEVVRRIRTMLDREDQPRAQSSRGSTQT